MSIYQIQEQLRGLPDDQLLREMQQPSGAAPQYLILTEIERRQQLRRGAQAKPPGQTVAQELAQGLAGIPSLPQGAPMPGGQMPAGVPAQMPAQMPAGADAGIAAMQQPQGFASGGEVEEEGSDLFSDGLFGSILPAKGLIDWATERWDQKGPFGFGLISLLQDGFKNDPKKKAMMESEEVTPETSINSNMTPMARTYSSGGEVEDDDDGGFNPMGMLGGVLPMIADGFTDGNKYGSGVLGLLLNKRKPWESGGKSEGDMSPEADQSMNSNMTPTGFAGGDLVSYSPNFDKAVGILFGHEGGYNPKDLSSNAPVNFGIDQRANPDIDVKNLTKEGAKRIYKERYWDKIGGDNLSPGMAISALNIAANMGNSVANKFIKESGGDIQKFNDLARERYNSIIARNPEKFKRYEKTWLGRLDDVNKQSINTQGRSMMDSLYNAIPNREDITSVLARFSPPQASPPPAAAPTLTSSRFVPLPASTATRDPAQRAMVQGPGAQSTLSKTSLRREEAADQEKQNASEFETLLNKLTATNKAQQAAPMPQQGQGMMQRPQQDPEDEIGALINRLERKRNMAQDKRKKRLGYAEGGIIGYAEGDEVDATESYPYYVLEKLRSAGRTKLDPLGDMVQKPAHLMNDMEKFISGTEREGDYAPPDASGKPVSPSTQSILPSKYFSPQKAPDMTSPRFRPIKGLYGDMMGDPVYGPNTFSGVPILPGADGTTSKERSLADIYAELDALGKGGEMSPELKDLFNQLKRDKNQEMWLSLAQFGANLAAGQSPYFAENLGNATKAGIQTLIEGDRAAKSDIGAMINATLMDQQNRDVNRRSLIGNTSEIYRSDQEYRRAIETAKIALQKAQENAKKSPGYRESVSIEFEQKVSEAAEKLMQSDPTKKMTREEARAQVLKDMVQSSNVARTAGIGITSIRSEEDTGPVALDLVGGQ